MSEGAEMEVRLGIDTCFAVKRWPRPEDWAPIVADRLGLRLVEHSFDLVDPDDDMALLRIANVPPRGLSAHAVEQVESYRWRHGDAVAVGIMFEAHLAEAAGLLANSIVERQRMVLTSVGLPTTYHGAQLTELLEVMKVDKKSRGDLLRFVVIEDVGQPRILAGPSQGELMAAYSAIGGDDQ